MKLAVNNKPKVFTKLAGCVKFSNLLEFGEDEFKQVVKNIEKDELFKKLTFPRESNVKIISYQKYPKSEFRSNTLSLNDSLAAGPKASPDMEELLSKNGKVVEKIKKLGTENFKKYFIYHDTDLGLEEIALACDISLEETREIIEFLDTVDMQGSLTSFETPQTASTGKSKSDIIGRVTVKDNECHIEFAELHHTRGRYSINYQRLYAAQKENLFSSEELKKINKLIKSIEWVNSRKNLTYSVVESILVLQKEYLLSGGDEKKLVPSSQISLAAKLKLHRGSISRVCGRKSVETPWGDRKQLKFFFPSKKNMKKELIEKVISRPEYKDFSDWQIVETLKKEYNILMSRRTVCEYRNMLNIGANG